MKSMMRVTISNDKEMISLVYRNLTGSRFKQSFLLDILTMETGSFKADQGTLRPLLTFSEDDTHIDIVSPWWHGLLRGAVLGRFGGGHSEWRGGVA